ncbi:MAG: ligand-gated ion channel, partial [Planctomycetota bacterium]
MNRSHLLAFAVPIVLAATTAGQTVSADSLPGRADLPGVVRLARPNAGHGPTRVAIGLYVIDIAKITDIDLTATVDFHIRLEWNDPRLAAETEEVRVFALEAIWSPVPQVVNQR